MPVIVLAATKGGCGKSTLAAALAVEASRKGVKVAIIDLDPQQSLARWHELRLTEAGKDTPALVPLGKYPDRTLAKAAADGWDCVIVDCPPGSVRLTSQAMAVADFVVIPVRPSPLDVEALDVMVELCEQYERPFAFVLNATAPRSSMTAGAREYMAKKGPVLDVEVLNRQPYASAMILGSTASEADPKGSAGKEIAALWDAIAKRAGLSMKKTIASRK
jgi:chromosome partitioning protein